MEIDPKPEVPDVVDDGPPELVPGPPPSKVVSVASSAGRVRSKICDVRGCTSNSLRNPELLFVGVPGQNFPERRFVWLTLMQAIRDKKRSYVCSRHFAVPDDFKDFQEYISAPPGYKRQLMVKRGVVPHFNMPPLNMPGLPPLNDRWQLTLPVGMTESDRLRQARVTAMFGGDGGHHQGMGETSMAGSSASNRPANQQQQQQRNNNAVKRVAKGIQTETVFSSGQRKMQPSLQYCRLCLQRQDLEPIFTGDQTLIEPDLIDKIYGCTQILITVENDFPSSICTNCYENVQHFIKFRRSVQKNDQSLRSTAAAVGAFKPAPCPPLPSPARTTSGSAAPQARAKTVGKVTPMRPVPSTAPVRASLASPSCPGIIPLAPWSMPKTQQVEQQPQRRAEPFRTYEPPRQVMARKLVPTQSPVKVTSGNPMETDPFANVEESANAAWDSEQSGVQMGDRVVPVTLIRVQPEGDDVNANRSLSPGPEADDVQEEPQEDTSRRSFLQPKPLEQLLENARKTAPETEPEVLQAVQLIPSAVAEEVAKQRSAPKIFLRKAPVPSKRLGPVPTLSKVKEVPKFSTVPKIVRAVKFPGTLTTLFSGARKPPKLGLKPTKTASPELVKYNAVASPKPAESPKPEVPVPSAKPVSKPKPPPQVLKEVKVPEKAEPPRPLKPKLLPPAKPKQKENDVPESPKSTSSNPSDVSSPRMSRTRKIPAKFADTVGFPMPKVVIKPDPDAPQEAAPSPAKLPVVKSASELPELRVCIQDARPKAKQDASPAPKTRLSSGKLALPATKEPEKKTRVSKVKEVEKKSTTPVAKTKESTRNTPTPVSKSKQVEKKPVPPTKTKEAEKRSSVQPAKPKEAEKKPAPVPPKQIAKRTSKEAPAPERPAKRKSIPDEKESQRTKRTGSLETPPKMAKPNGSRQSAVPAAVSKAVPAPVAVAPAPRASACPFCSNRTFDEKKALVKHLRKRHGMDYATVRQRLAIYGGNW